MNLLPRESKVFLLPDLSVFPFAFCTKLTLFAFENRKEKKRKEVVKLSKRYKYRSVANINLIRDKSKWLESGRAPRPGTVESCTLIMTLMLHTG